MGYKNIAPPALFRAKFSQRTSGFPIVHINIENVQNISVKAPEARGFYNPPRSCGIAPFTRKSGRAAEAIRAIIFRPPQKVLSDSNKRIQKISPQFAKSDIIAMVSACSRFIFAEKPGTFDQSGNSD
jgi:hypothetical protein